MIELLALFVIVITLVLLGVWERKWHIDNLESIPLRILVNGSRGKSTVTRLITSMLKETGWHVIGKTTGSAAKMIYWFSEQERTIERPIWGPTISEQKMVVAEAAAWQADCLVTECMALKPSYQKVFQNHYTKSQLYVITNALADHLDVMGPTVEDVAEVFAELIPKNGMLVMADGPYVDTFTKLATARGTRIWIAKPNDVSEEQLAQFSYLLFRENVALALAVADALQIPHDKAWRGLLKTPADFGALRHVWLNEHVCFLNGFAANDVTSTIDVWKRVVESGFPAEHPLIIMNCRADRLERTEQFVDHVLSQLPAHTLFAVGEQTDPIRKAKAMNKLAHVSYVDLEHIRIEELLQTIQTYIDEKMKTQTKLTILGIGNIKGIASEMVERWLPKDE